MDRSRNSAFKITLKAAKPPISLGPLLPQGPALGLLPRRRVGLALVPSASNSNNNHRLLVDPHSAHLVSLLGLVLSGSLPSQALDLVPLGLDSVKRSSPAHLGHLPQHLGALVPRHLLQVALAPLQVPQRSDSRLRAALAPQLVLLVSLSLLQHSEHLVVEVLPRALVSEHSANKPSSSNPNSPSRLVLSDSPRRQPLADSERLARTVSLVLVIIVLDSQLTPNLRQHY